MNKSHALPGGIVLVLAMALTAPLAGQGQENLRETGPQLSAERSWAVQNELAAIEKDKESFVDKMLASWVPFVDNQAFDPVNELKPVAMKAPAWQILGASMVSDYQTMINVLRGKVGAGQFVNALDAPQPKAWAAASSQLNETSSQLVFTPIPPCRIVDTRGSGARTGILNPGVPRTFDLTTDAYTKGQGGQTSGCTGLPSFSHYGFAVNITVAGYSGNGGLQVYPAGGSIPATSIINYFPGAYAIANNGPVTGCYGCANDITINAFGAATHVILDVMGFYERASTSAQTGSSVSRFAGTPVSIAVGGAAFGTGGACPAGTVMIGGENDFNGTDVTIGETHQSTATTWVMWMVNHDGVVRTPTVYSRCLDTPVEQ